MSLSGQQGRKYGTAPGTPTANQYPNSVGVARSYNRSTSQWEGGDSSPRASTAPLTDIGQPPPIRRPSPVIDPSLLDHPTHTTPKKRLAETVGGRNKKVKKREAENPFMGDGRGYGRWHNATTSIAAIICNGSILDPDRRQLDDDELILFEKWTRLIEVLPHIEVEVAQRDNAGKMELAKLLELGRLNAKSEDNSKVKDAIDDFYDFGGKLPRKELRGFNHKVCARLIAPYDVDVDDPEVLRAYKEKTAVLVSGDLSLLLYENETINPDDPAEGLFRGIIPLKVGVLIAFGRSSARSEDPNDRRPGGVADIHKQYEVTIEFIAYCAVLAHFSLTSTRTLYLDGRGSFKYSEYYESIIVIFNRRSEPWRAKLLKFWNNYIYGERAYNIEQAIIGGNERFHDKTLASILFQIPLGVD